MAEFASARQEIAELGAAQRTLLNLNPTVSAGVFGFVLSNRVSADYVKDDLGDVIVDHTVEARLLGLIQHQERMRRPITRYLPAGLAIPVLFPAVPWCGSGPTCILAGRGRAGASACY